jgi:hypothetical protein
VKENEDAEVACDRSDGLDHEDCLIVAYAPAVLAAKRRQGQIASKVGREGEGKEAPMIQTFFDFR